MPKKSYQYWGVYETGVAATPRGPKKIVEEMAGMLSKPDNTGRQVCIKKGERGFGTLGEATGVCYINGVRQLSRKPRAPRPRKPKPLAAPISAPAPTLAAPELPPEPKKPE
ncbi:MAG: hypothetical protein PVG95_09315 [Methyloceanibacter sp.]|jgi:hypothetical protein